jgi:hypothetical protein
MYEDFELLYDFIINFKVQLDIGIKSSQNTFNSEILLRMYKLPCSANLKISL